MDTITQDIADALDEAGRLMAPILQNAGVKVNKFGTHIPSIAVTAAGTFTCHCFLGRDQHDHLVSVVGLGESASIAFADMLAKRSDKLAALERERASRDEFEEWKRQREQVAA